MKHVKHIAVMALLALSCAPAWSQSYFQDWNVPDSETSTPVTGGSIFGADVISRGTLNNQMYIMMNDTTPTNNFFVAGYFQTFSSGVRNFSGMQLDLDVKQIPVGGVLNPLPSQSHFFFELAFDKNGDGVYTDGVDNTWRTSLTGNPFLLPGSGGSHYAITLNPGNFGVAGDISGAFDLTKVTRVGFGLLQNVEGGTNFPDGSNLGWSFDNLTVAAIPEPQTWATTLVGLACLAGFLRRRK